MDRSATRWFIAGVALAASVAGYYFGFVRHGKATLSPAKVSAQARQAIADGNVEARRQAAWELALSPNVNNRAALEKALQDKDAEVRHTAILGLGWLKDPNSATVLAQAAKEKDASARQDVAWALGQLPEHRGYEALSALMKDSDRTVATSAIVALGRLAYPGAGEAFSTNELPYFALEESLTALIRLKAPSALDAVEAIADQELEMALKFAARIDGCRGIPFMVSTAATRNDYKISQVVSTSLADSTQPCVFDALVQMLVGAPPIRRQIASLLLEFGGPRAIGELQRLEQDADPTTARIATNGLDQAFKQRRLDVPDILALVRASTNSSPNELDRFVPRLRILRALVGAGLTSQGGHLKWLDQARADIIVPELIARLDLDKKTWRRHSAILALADESSLPALAEVAKSSDPKLREFIAETLVGMSSSSAQALQLALSSDSEHKVRVAALKAYRIAAPEAAETRIATMLASDQPADFQAAYAASAPKPSSAVFARALQDMAGPDENRRKWASAVLAYATGEQLQALVRQLNAAPQQRKALLDILQRTKAVDATVLSQSDIIPIVSSTLEDADGSVVESMACLMSQATGEFSSGVEALYQKKEAPASLRKLLASEAETARDCAKGALLLIGDELGLASLLSKERTAYDWSDALKRLRGRVTVALAKKMTQRLTGEEDNPPTEFIEVLSTAPASVISQTYVPLLCNNSAPEHARLLSVSATWGIPSNLGQLPEGNGRECLIKFARDAFARGHQDGGVKDEQQVAVGIVEQLREKSLVDALVAFSQNLEPGYLSYVALRALSRVGDLRGIPLILREISSPQPGNGVASALANYDDARVLPGLLSATTNIKLREDSVGLLANRLPKEQWLLLADLATDNCKTSYCASGVWKYRTQLRITVPEDKIDFRLREASSIKGNLQLLADPLSNHALISLLSAFNTQAEIPEALHRFNHPSAVDTLKAALNHPNSHVRGNAIRLLVAWKVPGIFELIAAALNDNISEVRVAAADALGNLDDPKAVQYLGDFIATWDLETSEFSAGLCAWARLRKDEAAKALGAYTSSSYLSHNIDSAIPRVIHALGCTHSELAVDPIVSHWERFNSNEWQAIDALGESRTPAAAQALLKFLSKGHRSVEILNALAKFKNPNTLTALLGELSRTTTIDSNYVSALINIIASYKEKRATEELVKGLSHANCDDTRVYMTALVSTHDEAVRGPIEQTGIRCHMDVKTWIRDLLVN